MIAPNQPTRQPRAVTQHVLRTRARRLGDRQWRIIKHLRALGRSAAPQRHTAIATGIGYEHSRDDVLASLLGLEVRGLITRTTRDLARRCTWTLTDDGWRA
jgi:hypothetical protein